MIKKYLALSSESEKDEKITIKIKICQYYNMFTVHKENVILKKFISI